MFSKKIVFITGFGPAEIQISELIIIFAKISNFPSLEGKGVILEPKVISAMFSNFLKRIFLDLCIICLGRTVSPLFAAVGVIYNDFCRSRGFNGHLRVKGVIK